SVPTLEVELSLRALVHGRVAPREVELRGLELTLVREKNGRIGLVPGKSLSEPDESVMLETLLGSGPSGGPLAQLERIALREGQLARLRLPVKGSVALELDGSLRPRRVRLSAEGGHGSIVATELRARVVPIERLRGHVTLELEENALAVEDVVLDLGGPTVGFVGRIGLDEART